MISLQKSYNGCKHNNKVALLLGEFAACVEQKGPSCHVALDASSALFQSDQTFMEVNKYSADCRLEMQPNKNAKQIQRRS